MTVSVQDNEFKTRDRESRVLSRRRKGGQMTIISIYHEVLFYSFIHAANVDLSIRGNPIRPVAGLTQTRPAVLYGSDFPTRTQPGGLTGRHA